MSLAVPGLRLLFYGYGFGCKHTWGFLFEDGLRGSALIGLGVCLGLRV